VGFQFCKIIPILEAGGEPKNLSSRTTLVIAIW